MHALEIGADDYLVKPFSMRELAPACGQRRAAGPAPGPAPRRRGRDRGGARPKNVQAYVDGRRELTPTEFRLLYALALEWAAC